MANDLHWRIEKCTQLSPDAPAHAPIEQKEIMVLRSQRPGDILLVFKKGTKQMSLYHNEVVMEEFSLLGPTAPTARHKNDTADLLFTYTAGGMRRKFRLKFAAGGGCGAVQQCEECASWIHYFGRMETDSRGSLDTSFQSSQGAYSACGSQPGLTYGTPLPLSQPPPNFCSQPSSQLSAAGGFGFGSQPLAPLPAYFPSSSSSSSSSQNRVLSQPFQPPLSTSTQSSFQPLTPACSAFRGLSQPTSGSGGGRDVPGPSPGSFSQPPSQPAGGEHGGGSGGEKELTESFLADFSQPSQTVSASVALEEPTMDMEELPPPAPETAEKGVQTMTFSERMLENEEVMRDFLRQLRHDEHFPAFVAALQNFLH